MDSTHRPSVAAAAATGTRVPVTLAGDHSVPLFHLAALGERLGDLRGVLADSVSGGAALADEELRLISSEIASIAQQIILDGAALLAAAHPLPPPPSAVPLPKLPPPPTPSPAPAPAAPPLPPAPAPAAAVTSDGDYDVVEIDAEELLVEHVHFCEICGKGFRRDANLRMHMRAHGDQFKTLDALSRPGRAVADAGGAAREVRFSCPFAGCNRNRAHRRFRPLKSAVCARNHFKRSHCPKMYACQRCGKKSFAVLADLRSHMKHCGETQWRCSCGTTFSRKDKLFGHLALFEGHMPAIGEGSESNKNDILMPPVQAKVEEEKEDAGMVSEGPRQGELFDSEFLEDWMHELCGVEIPNCR